MAGRTRSQAVDQNRDQTVASSIELLLRGRECIVEDGHHSINLCLCRDDRRRNEEHVAWVQEQGVEI